MEKLDIENKDFFELALELEGENYCISSFGALKDYVVECVKDCNFSLAIHIMEALYNGMDAEWFYYDYSMGELCTPEPIYTKEDLKSYIY